MQSGDNRLETQLTQSSVAPSRSDSFQPNPAQGEAIYHVHGPMLVLAGAGTGKTSVLVHRIVNLISTGHARPDEIMAVTFTNKAAGEIRERVTEQLGSKHARKVRTCTFHGYCNELLKASGFEFGLLTKEDLWVYLRQRIKRLPLDYFVKASDPGRFLDDLPLVARRPTTTDRSDIVSPSRRPPGGPGPGAYRSTGHTSDAP